MRAARPPGVPAEIVAQLNEATNEFLTTDQAKDMFTKLGVEKTGGTPQDLDAFVASVIEKWTPIIRGAGIRF